MLNVVQIQIVLQLVLLEYVCQAMLIVHKFKENLIVTKNKEFVQHAYQMGIVLVSQENQDVPKQTGNAMNVLPIGNVVLILTVQQIVKRMEILQI